MILGRVKKKKKINSGEISSNLKILNLYEFMILLLKIVIVFVYLFFLKELYDLQKFNITIRTKITIHKRTKCGCMHEYSSIVVKFVLTTKRFVVQSSPLHVIKKKCSKLRIISFEDPKECHSKSFILIKSHQFLFYFSILLISFYFLYLPINLVLPLTKFLLQHMKESLHIIYLFFLFHKVKLIIPYF